MPTTMPKAIARALSRQPLESLAAGAAMCAAPLSIAVCESFLAISLVARIAVLIRSRTRLDAEGLDLPRVFYFWLLWASLEIVAWLRSSLVSENLVSGSLALRTLSAGKGEIRHLLLLAALFIIVPALRRPGYTMLVWRGIFLAATAGSLSLIVSFAARAIQYRQAIAAGGDPAFYLRTGGLLHHWMVYSTVEILVFGALLEFRAAYPEERRWVTPALAVNCLAILLSLTRSLWLGCLVLMGLHLIYRPSKRVYAKWTWAVAAVLIPAMLLALRPVRNRIAESLQPDYYSNAERLQMWRVGWKMIHEQPVFGVGPGRVEELYTRYLLPGEPVPAYHGHLHNNALQLAAQFGIPVPGAAVLCLCVLLKDLVRCYRRAPDREARFLARSGLLGVAGFLTVGMMDYTYGHSLGLILLGFVALAPLTPVALAPLTPAGRT